MDEESGDDDSGDLTYAGWCECEAHRCGCGLFQSGLARSVVSAQSPTVWNAAPRLTKYPVFQLAVVSRPKGSRVSVQRLSVLPTYLSSAL